MSGWYGSMDYSMTDGDYFSTYGESQEQTQAKTDQYRHFQNESASSARLYNESMANNTVSSKSGRNALLKKAGVGLVAGAVVGMVLLKVPMYNSMMSKDKSWQAAALGAAVAVPLAAMYA